MVKRINNNKSINTSKWEKTNEILKTKTVKSSSTHKNERYLVKRILFTTGLSIIIVIGTYFWIIFFLSNVSSFWDIFRKKELNANERTYLPPAPYINPLSEAYKESNIDISGKSIAGYKIKLFIDDSFYTEALSDNSGKFSFTGIPLGLIPKQFNAIAVDVKGIESDKSVTYTVVLDKDPPDLEIKQPKDNEEYKNTGHSYEVIGNTEPGAKVWVNNQLSIVNSEGEFNKSIRLEEGNNEIKIKAVDKAGNEKELKLKITFIKIN